MRSLRTLLWAAAAAGGTVAVTAAVHSLASWSAYFAVPVDEMLATSGFDALLTPSTGWMTSSALVMTVCAWAAAARSSARWWRPSAVGTGLLVGWTAAAWVDGAQSTRAPLDGQQSQTWFAWPGESTPLHAADLLVATSWSLDVLSATGPAIAVVALWTGPLLLRSHGAGRPETGPSGRLVARPGGCSGSSGTTAATAARGADAASVLVREVTRTVSVASVAAVLLCLGVVLLQTAGGLFSASASLGDGGWVVLLEPGALVIVWGSMLAWTVGGGAARLPDQAPCRRAATGLLLTAVATSALLVPLEPDLVMLLAAVVGVLVGAVRLEVAQLLGSLLLREPQGPARATTGTGRLAGPRRVLS